MRVMVPDQFTTTLPVVPVGTTAEITWTDRKLAAAMLTERLTVAATPPIVALEIVLTVAALELVPIVTTISRPVAAAPKATFENVKELPSVVFVKDSMKVNGALSVNGGSTGKGQVITGELKSSGC